MSRSSAKERSRVQDSGRHVSTFRVVENFGSWKHQCYLPGDCPALIPLSRRFIGGKNSGRKLALSLKTIEIRKRTKRMVTKFEEGLWSGPEFRLVTIKKGSNYPNPKKLRRMDKESAATEMASYLEAQKEALDAERQDAEQEFQCRAAESERSEELGEIILARLRLIKPKAENWGYHHFF